MYTKKVLNFEIVWPTPGTLRPLTVKGVYLVSHSLVCASFWDGVYIFNITNAIEIIEFYKKYFQELFPIYCAHNLHNLEPLAVENWLNWPEWSFRMNLWSCNLFRTLSLDWNCIKIREKWSYHSATTTPHHNNHQVNQRVKVLRVEISLFEPS